jgi:acetylornithine deacetylase/succinyl-diaminopimelate desuccinylase-like protein
MTSRPVDRVLGHLESAESDSIDRLCEWLRVPSVSTDPAHREDVRRAAQWAADHLGESGISAELVETGVKDKPGHPIVMAHVPGDKDYRGPHVLFYGHYDVQPPDPLDLWESGPFEPVLKRADATCPSDRIVARGACDDKGQVATFLESLRSWHAVTDKPAGGVKMTIMLEGEEESGSVNLGRFLETEKVRLEGSEFCLISDTGMLGRDKPAITYGVRGLSYIEVRLHGPDQDLHSGLWGGRVVNPNAELVKVLAQLWDAKRRVTIPGFYDSVREASDDERSAWRRLRFDQIEALRKIGLGSEADVGEAGYTPLEREWSRPTAEINGIYGGYTGKGAKTVIPAHAGAKVSFRLVADQDPERVRDAAFAWFDQHTPPGCRWEFIDHGGGPPATVATESRLLQAAARALERAGGTGPALIRTGGSIPVAGMLKSSLGLDTVFMGFGLDDDRVHSPNEKFELPCFRLGARAHAVLIDELWRLGEA